MYICINLDIYDYLFITDKISFSEEIVDCLTQEFNQFPTLSKDCNIKLNLSGKFASQTHLLFIYIFIIVQFLF